MSFLFRQLSLGTMMGKWLMGIDFRENFVMPYWHRVNRGLLWTLTSQLQSASTIGLDELVLLGTLPTC
mgnify:CR=1 FL=1